MPVPGLNVGFNKGPLNTISSRGLFGYQGVSAGFSTNAGNNTVGMNFPAGGGASLEYEGFPVFIDRVREGRGFIIGTGYVTASLNSSGYPDGTQSSVNLILYTGQSTGLGLQPWFWNGSAYRTFTCTLTGNGAETFTGVTGCSITGITRPGGGVVNFNLTMDGTGNPVYFSISGITTALSNVHCWLPDYPNGVGGVGPNNEFTTWAVNQYSQYDFIRFMWWQNAWNNIVHTTAANRNTALNTQANKQWSAPGGTNSEGYPFDWAINMCIACNTGGWFHIPADFSADYVQALATALLNNMPVGKPIFIEYANEIWNGTGKARNVIQAFANTAGYQDAQFTGSITGSTLTVSGVTGTINTNDNLYYSGSPSGVFITGGSNPTYSLSTSPGNTGAISMTCNSLNNLYQYLANPLHTISGIFKTTFGARYGTDLRMVLGVQQGQGKSAANKTITTSISLGFMPSTGWASAATADYHHIALAPYINLNSIGGNQPAAAWSSATAYVAGQTVASGGVVYLCILGNTNNVPPNATFWTAQSAWSVAQIEANLAGTDNAGNSTQTAAVSCLVDNMEGMSVEARYYGLISVITYEGGWQTNGEQTSTTNIGNAIIDSGMTAVEQLLNQNMYNSGGTHLCHFEGGCASLNALSGSGMLFDQLDYSNASLIAGTSPRFLAQKAFFSGNTPTKNAISASGSSFPAYQWADNRTTTQPAFDASFFGVAPPYNVHGLIPFNLNVTRPGTYSLRVFFTNASATAGHCDVNIDGVNVITGTSIVTGSITNTLITLGNVTLTAGPHSLLLGRSGTINANVTLSSNVTWV